ncbi:MAG: hypothetical protein RLZZ231_1496 [Bacteroidota bacterium]|jgi:hypothetical protein
MQKKLALLSLVFLSLLSCTDSDDTVATDSNNKVLLLKVDYLTNTFIGGKELAFGTQNSSFTVTHEYTPPGDFGNLKLNYSEMNAPIFDGSIIWMGVGQMNYPQDVLPATSFDHVLTADYVTPNAGFTNVFNPDMYNYDYAPVWGAVQGLVKTRQYLASNPNGSVKLFLYTPSVGFGNPADWYWVVFLKN